VEFNDNSLEDSDLQKLVLYKNLEIIKFINNQVKELHALEALVNRHLQVSSNIIDRIGEAHQN